MFLSVGLLIFLTISHVPGTYQDNDGLDLLANLIPANYSKLLRPNYGREKVDVNVWIKIMFLGDINEKNMDFRCQFYLRHKWLDTRLAFSPDYNISQIVLTEQYSKQIWVPDTIIGNVKTMNHHKQIYSSEPAEYVQIFSEGEVFYSKMIDIVAGCSMDFHNYPFDLQTCTIEIESYGIALTDMEYFWWHKEDGPVSMARSSDSSFQLLGYKTLNIVERRPGGNQNKFRRQALNRLILELYLIRDYGSYVSQIYLPSFLLVVLSWIPLWLNQNAQFARLEISLLTVLTITIQSSTYNASFPATSYSKLIDTYLLACWIFVFFTLIECFVVTYLGSQLDYVSFRVRNDGKPAELNVIDKWARWLIPAAFVGFNAVYYGHVMVIEKELGAKVLEN